MVNKAASSILSIVEKAYFRLQAGDVITHCLEDGSTDPVHELIQDMVVAGPQSLEGLREILGETIKRKSQVYDDLNQVTNQLSIILRGYGLSAEGPGGNQVLQSMQEDQFLVLLDEQRITSAEARTGSLQVMRDSQELMSALMTKIQLLERIEIYLKDWLWGLTYQHIRQGDEDSWENTTRNELQ